MNIDEIKKRARRLAEKIDSNSISAKEVGDLFFDTLDYADKIERNGGSLGVLKTYASVAAMQADSEPVDFSGKALKRGNLVCIVSRDSDNGNLYAYQKPGWQPTGNIVDTLFLKDKVEAHDEKLRTLEQEGTRKNVKNLYNPNDPEAKSGFYVVSTNGELDINSHLKATGFIPVKPGKPYIGHKTSQYAFFDKDKVYISGGGNLNIAVQAPDNAAFLRVSMYLAYENGNRINESNVLLPHYPFRSYVQNEVAVSSDNIEDNEIYGDKIQERSVSKDKLDFDPIYTEKGNLYNPNDPEAKSGFYVVEKSGELLENANLKASGYIPIVEGKSYIGYKTNQCAFFDSNKAYISGVNNIDSAVQAPERAVFIRVSFYINSESENRIFEGTVLKPYEPFDKPKELPREILLHGESIIDGTISKDKLDFSISQTSAIKSSKNLLNSNDITLHAFINWEGKVEASSSGFSAVSGFIRFTKEMGTLIMSSNGVEINSAGGFVCLYDKDYKPIPGMQNNVSKVNWVENAVWARFTLPNFSYAPGYSDYLQIEAGNSVTPYEPYYNILDLNLLPNAPKGLSCKGELLKNGDEIQLYPNYVRMNKHLAFSGKLVTMGRIRIGHGKSKDYGCSYIEVDETNIYIYGNGGDLAKTQAHGLTFKNNIQVLLDVAEDYVIKIKLITNGNIYSMEYTKGGEVWGGSNGRPYAESLGIVISSATLSWTCDGYSKDIQMYGDSYFGHKYPARWIYWLIQFGFAKNALIDGFGGEGADNALTSFRGHLRITKPKFVVWALGMNNPDTESAISDRWLKATKSFLSDCKAIGITPILCTIPTVVGGKPEDSNVQGFRQHKFKNQWIKESGYRYIDFAEAVGANDDTGLWYEGMLSSDFIHPSETGAITLCLKALTDFPELMMHS